MRRCLIGLTALFTLALVTPASAQPDSGHGFYTGSALMRLCKNTDRTESTPDFASYSECVAFLSGVIDTYGMLMNLDAIPKAICSPSWSLPRPRNPARRVNTPSRCPRGWE